MSDENWVGDMPDDNWGLDLNFYWGCGNNSHGRLFTETKRVVWSWTDGSDEPAFAWIVELKDGRHAAVEGWHDYTGWDCRSGLDVNDLTYSLAECVRYLTETPRHAYEEGAARVA